jgi:cbb3-type cytochrome oxidase cytochrome c subunit
MNARHAYSGRVAGLLLVAVPTVTLCATWWNPPEQPAGGIELGRRVYVAEGCIHCHSQYIRPGTVDEEQWGPARDPNFSRNQEPAVIGNRRQGPDLMTVGQRLPRDWHRRHLIDPRSVAPASRMPSYAYLFRSGDPRGEALLDYLASLGRENVADSRATSGRPDSVIAGDARADTLPASPDH